MKFAIKIGTKNDHDYKLHVWSNGEAIKFEDVLKILRFLFENEDRIYPRPRFKGREMLLNAIRDLYNGKSVEEIKRRYQLS